MKYKKGFMGVWIAVAVVAVLVIAGGAYYIGKTSTYTPKNLDNNYRPYVNPNPVVNTAPVVPPVNTQPVSTTLPEYIYGQEHWPPVIKDSSNKYSCMTGRVGMGVQVTTSEKIINDKTYCVVIADEGAMGKIYKTYTYTTSLDGGTKTTTFTLAYQECGAFRDDSST